MSSGTSMIAHQHGCPNMTGTRLPSTALLVWKEESKQGLSLRQ